MKKYSIALLFSILLFSCSVPVRFYLRNTSAESVKIRILPSKAETATTTLSFEEQLLAVKFNLHERLHKKLEPIETEPPYLYFLLPPHSTFFIGMGINFSYYDFDEIIIYRENAEDVVINRENQNLLKVKNSFPAKYFVWYDIN